MMSCGIVYASYAKKCGSTTIVMSPGHLCQKWKREVQSFVPNSKAYIIESIEDLKKIDKLIRDKLKKEHMFLIISKEDAKLSYNKRPCAIWKENPIKNGHKMQACFVCPECGKPLFKEVWVGTGRDRHKDIVYLSKKDFLKEDADNLVCDNNIRKLNKATNRWREFTCNAKLWTSLNRLDETDAEWIKLGKQGWILKKHLDSLNDELNENRESLSKKDRELFVKILEAKSDSEVAGDVASSSKGTRRYSLAKYIREKYSHNIDYLIIDELHQLKGDCALQAEAMGDFASIAGKIIGLTGTLINGYAKSLYYILYRIMPRTMKNKGFEYEDVRAFQRLYGVVKKKTTHEKSRSGRGKQIKTNADKDQPGVSPLLFTEYLLENACFIDLSDISEDLPGYEEIPVAVEMDEELETAYTTYENSLRSACSWRNGGGKKTMGTLLQSLQTYPDMPYDQPSMLHPDTLEVLAVPPELPKGLRNKENALLDIVKEKKEAGEKVLVYYQYTNRIDTADKLINMFKDNDIKVVHLTAKEKLKQREAWIMNNAKNIDVMICNPKLVETGLDLLDFTTIIFYQLGYDIFVTRQASKRSYRIGQDKDVKVYFMYYKNTIQETTVALMASKMKASKVIEGKVSEESLLAMANTEDLMAKVAASVVSGIKNTVKADAFDSTRIKKERKTDDENGDANVIKNTIIKNRKPLIDLLVKIYKREYINYSLYKTSIQENNNVNKSNDKNKKKNQNNVSYLLNKISKNLTKTV